MKIGNFVPRNNVFLAPMAGVTDKVFRMICAAENCGLVYTEMVSSKGLFYGSQRTDLMLDIDALEAPAAVQIFGSDPEIMAEMAAEISSNDRVGIIDINMGCPAPKIVKNNEGSALMKNPELAGRIIQAVALSSKKPVTVKFRKGWDAASVNAVEFAKRAEASGACAIAIHGRTREQMYEGKADWEIIRDVKKAVGIPVIGNGDVTSPEAAKELLLQTECDAMMIGRAALGNPWIFRRTVHFIETGELLDEIPDNERLDTALLHLQMNLENKGKRGLFEMRKQLAWYVKGMKNATHVKNEINRIEDYEELRALLKSYKNSLETGDRHEYYTTNRA